MPKIQTGQIAKAPDGSYRLRWYEPNGARPQRSGFRTRTEARRYFRDEVMPRLERGEPHRGDTTLDQLVDSYLTAHAAGRSPRTIAALRERLRYAQAEFGSTPIERIRPMDVAAWAAGLPPRYRYALVQALRQTINAAVSWRMIPENPARLAGPNPEPRREEVEPFTPEQVDQIAVELGARFGSLVVLAVETGLRPSEWIALERGDVAHDLGLVTVERTIVDGGLRRYGKTDGSRRSVPLSTRALTAIKDVPARLDTRLLFPAPAGGPLSLDNWRNREWYPALDAAGIATCGPYRLRHTAATRWLAAGLSLFEVARYLGSSVRMVDRTYGHLERGAEQHVRDRLDAYAQRDVAVRTRDRTSG